MAWPRSLVFIAQVRVFTNLQGMHNKSIGQVVAVSVRDVGVVMTDLKSPEGTPIW